MILLQVVPLGNMGKRLSWKKLAQSWPRLRQKIATVTAKVELEAQKAQKVSHIGIIW